MFIKKLFQRWFAFLSYWYWLDNGLLCSAWGNNSRLHETHASIVFCQYCFYLILEKIFGQFFLFVFGWYVIQSLKLFFVKDSLIVVTEITHILHSGDLLFGQFYTFECFTRSGEDRLFIEGVLLICLVSLTEGLHFIYECKKYLLESELLPKQSQSYIIKKIVIYR